MEERFERLERDIITIAESVARLEQRLATLETGADLTRARRGQSPTVSSHISSDEPTALDAAAAATSVLSLLGRSLLVLAGAFLLRAVTDAGAVPASIGVALGFMYAAGWLVVTHAVARRTRLLSATFYGLCSAAIGYPLIWEAATTFEVVTPESAVLAAAVVALSGLFVAWRCALRAMAWVFTVAAIGTVVALLTISQITVVAAGFLVLLGLVTLWIARFRGWVLLPWLPAVVADLLVMRTVAMVSTSARDGTSLAMAWLLVAALVLGYLGTVAIFVLMRRRLIDAFDVVQTALVLAVGTASGARLAVGASTWLLGAAGMVAGAACYATAFTFVERDAGRGRNYVYISTLALALILIGSSYNGGEPIVSVLWALLGLLTAFLGSRFDRMTLRAHGAIFAVAAAIHSGLVGFAVGALAGPVTGPWRQPSASVHLVAAVVAASMAVLASSRLHRGVQWWFRLPLVALAAISAAGVCAEVVVLLASPSLVDIGSTAGLAMIRTGVVAVATLALAALAVRLQVPELRWVVYPVLCLLGLKILFQDLPAGNPTSIAVAFLFYGAALIMSTRRKVDSDNPIHSDELAPVEPIEQ